MAKFRSQPFRKMNTGDAEDYEVKFDEQFDVMWAESTETSKLEYHTDRKVASMKLNKP